MNKSNLPHGWCYAVLEDLLNYEQPTRYIVSSTDYDDCFKTPVLTAGKSFLLGYTNEKDGIFKNLPVIIFDDFTTAIKFVTFPFKVKSSAMKILIPKHSEVNMKYVHYFMKTVRINVDTHKRYWISIGSKLPILLPPSSEQERIVAKIEELFSKLDKGIETLNKAKEQLKVYRQAVLKWAFEGRLTNEEIIDNILPEGWTLQELRKIGSWKGGGTPSKANSSYWDNGTIDWITPKDMKSALITSSEDKVTLSAIDNSSAKLIAAGSILIVVRSGILRRTLPIGLVEHEVTINQDMQAITPSSAVPKYIYYCIKAFAESIRKECSKDGTTVESIDTSSLKKFKVPVAPVNEQKLIVDEIESRMTVCEKISEGIEVSLQQAEALRQSILKKAFEGKLVPQDPNDEPASELLKRIKQQVESVSESLPKRKKQKV